MKAQDIRMGMVVDIYETAKVYGSDELTVMAAGYQNAIVEGVRHVTGASTIYTNLGEYCVPSEWDIPVRWEGDR